MKFNRVEYTELEAAALQWLRYEQRCLFVMTQRGVAMLGDPDVFGITAKRRTIEIEIKMTLADFKRDASKRSRRSRDSMPHLKPWKFYFLTPPKLAERIKDMLPPGAGLMTLGAPSRFMPTREARVMVSAECNSAAQELAVRHLKQAAEHMSATLVRQHARLFEALKGN